MHSGTKDFWPYFTEVFVFQRIKCEVIPISTKCSSYGGFSISVVPIYVLAFGGFVKRGSYHAMHVHGWSYQTDSHTL